ncbi:hypothetical protein PMAC_001397 [Pneumocystis sp. 'macacae']|nr:hypothetical protein PMAC_001397 [Pneumocystis sp. 'macacae']
MDQFKKALVQQIRLRLAETWLSRVCTLTTWLDELASEYVTDDIDQSPLQSTDDFLTTDAGHSKKRRILNTPSNDISPTLSVLKTGQARVKRECFLVLRACDETRILVNLRFPDTPSHTLKVLEDVLSELSQVQTACTTIRASISQYALSRAKALRKTSTVGLSDFAAAAGASAVLEIDEEAVFHLFQHLAQLRNIYVVLYTLLQKHRVLLGL